MTTFLDGPAQGQTLQLKRAPIFLRVVFAELGGRTESGNKWDALDQLEDLPAAHEKIYAYQVEGKVSGVHINRGGGKGGFFTVANYRFIPNQPDDTTLRTNEAWHGWCVMNDPRK